MSSSSSPPQIIKTFEDFVEVHALLLAASGIPSSLHRRLFHKLSSDTLDGGDFFAVEPCEDGRQRRLVLSADRLGKESDVFVVDHAWTFRLSDAPKMLREVPGLAERMAALMCVDGEEEEVGAEEGEEGEEGEGLAAEARVSEIVEREMERLREKGCDAPVWLEFEEMEIDDEMLRSMDLSSKFPNLVALNLWGNKLQNAESIVQEITKCKNLKAIWLNDNPVLQDHKYNIADAIVKELPGLEIFNSHFTSNYSKWALGFCGEIYGLNNPIDFPITSISLENITLLDLSSRGICKLNHDVLSPAVMPSLSHLNLQGNSIKGNSIDDLLNLLQGFSHIQKLEVDIPGPLGSSALNILEHLPNLSYLNNVSRSNILECGKHVIYSALQPRFPEWSVKEPLADRVIGAMWLYMLTYRLADEEKIDETSVWYVMDELGSALRHSDEPNFKVAPFLYMPEGSLSSSISYSVLWPIQHVGKGEECTRDFLFGIGEEKQRSARLTAWFHTPDNYFVEEFRKYCKQLMCQQQMIPQSHAEVHRNKSILPSDGRALRVYTDLPQVDEYLTREEFVLTNDPQDADIIWTAQQVDEEVRNALGLKDSQYINQFPFEACLVMKHHLAETIHAAQGSPEWLQPTYNLETHLSALIGDYYVRKQEGLDNLWIIKPWNMARTIDTTVTGNLSSIIRLMETGPKICQKYIERPALFNGKKFDLRYVVLVRSMNPLEIFLSDVFWVRLANNTYSLEKNSLFEYETHFTVMNYIGKLNHVATPDFVRQFEEEHQVVWQDIHQRIRHMIKVVFDSAKIVRPDMHSPMSRAIYGVDVMLDSRFKPKLLEVTYCPDCTRACSYDMVSIVGGGEILEGREFFNNVFGCLFLNESNNVTPL